MTICELCEDEVKNRKEIEFHAAKNKWTALKLCKVCRDSLHVDFLKCSRCRLAAEDEAVTKEKAQYCIDCIKSNCKNSSSRKCEEIRAIAKRLITRLEQIQSFDRNCVECSFAEDPTYVQNLTIQEVRILLDKCEKCKGPPNKKAISLLKKKIL